MNQNFKCKNEILKVVEKKLINLDIYLHKIQIPDTIKEKTD